MTVLGSDRQPRRYRARQRRRQLHLQRPLHPRTFGAHRAAQRVTTARAPQRAAQGRGIGARVSARARRAPERLRWEVARRRAHRLHDLCHPRGPPPGSGGHLGRRRRGPMSRRWRLARTAGLVLRGLALLVLGARWLVDASVELARALGISEAVIGLTLVAAGTSLPEVATSIVATVRGERDIAVGNVIGSNLYHILAILGLAALLAPDGLAVNPSVLGFDLPVMVAAAVACLPVFFIGGVIARWQGRSSSATTSPTWRILCSIRPGTCCAAGLQCGHARVRAAADLRDAAGAVAARTQPLPHRALKPARHGLLGGSDCNVPAPRTPAPGTKCWYHSLARRRRVLRLDGAADVAHTQA